MTTIVWSREETISPWSNHHGIQEDKLNQTMSREEMVHEGGNALELDVEPSRHDLSYSSSILKENLGVVPMRNQSDEEPTMKAHKPSCTTVFECDKMRCQGLYGDATSNLGGRSKGKGNHTPMVGNPGATLHVDDQYPCESMGHLGEVDVASLNQDKEQPMEIDV